VSLASAAQYAVFLGVVILPVKPVGGYLYRVFSHQETLLEPVECFLYRAAGVDVTHEMNGVEYALAFVLFSLTGTLLLYAFLRLQTLLPGAVAIVP